MGVGELGCISVTPAAPQSDAPAVASVRALRMFSRLSYPVNAAPMTRTTPMFTRALFVSEVNQSASGRRRLNLCHGRTVHCHGGGLDAGISGQPRSMS